MFRKSIALQAVAVIALAAALGVSDAQAAPAVGASVRAGTTGIGLDFDVGFSRHFGARVGYSDFGLNRTLTTGGNSYAGSLHLSAFTALADWYVFGGGFHLTAGLAHDGVHADGVAQPIYGYYTLNGVPYTSDQVSSLSGAMKFPHSTAPYVGIGWGNPVGLNHRVHFLVDIGAIYGGSPVVSLDAKCGPAAPMGSPMCSQIQADTAAEEQRLEHNARAVTWFPVINVGLSVRF